jgi:hypothetical protein
LLCVDNSRVTCCIPQTPLAYRWRACTCSQVLRAQACTKASLCCRTSACCNQYAQHPVTQDYCIDGAHEQRSGPMCFAWAAIMRSHACASCTSLVLFAQLTASAHRTYGKLQLRYIWEQLHQHGSHANGSGRHSRRQDCNGRMPGIDVPPPTERATASLHGLTTMCTRVSALCAHH